MALKNGKLSEIKEILLENGVFLGPVPRASRALLLGEDVAVTGFSAAETVVLKENASVVLDAAKAKWLNSCAGGKTAVGSAAAGLSAREFADAYLLNLDITEADRSYAFEITGVDVGAETVTVGVKLTRNGHIAQSINGTLKFYGAATLDAFKSPNGHFMRCAKNR